MADSRHETGAPNLICPEPHRRTGPRRPPDPDVVPLRLRLRPGRLAVELTRSGAVFGRHSSADVRLPLPDVSRRHCRFVWEDGRWLVVDLDSLNGVFVNDAPVLRAELRHRDRVRIGGFIFDVDLSAAADDANSGAVLRSIADALPPAAGGDLRRAS
jgi:predicted component of type VI protein secretion system